MRNDPSEIYDIAVIGGGINGCGIARDAAGRGLKVFLCEQADLGSGASSTSSKLIHGGLRYLEQREFKLVRESLQERETLLKSAPHLITPLRFVLPHHPSARPIWLIRLGLLIYDFLGGGRSLARSRWVDLAHHHGTALKTPALKTKFTAGFEYSDCWADDARLVIAVAQDARRLGATIWSRARCDSADRTAGLWDLRLRDMGLRDMGLQKIGARAQLRIPKSVRAKALVDVTGPWVARLPLARASDAAPPSAQPRIKLVQGSHIVVKKWFAGDHAYILQNDDQRIVFVIPFQRDLAIIGTTEVEFHGDPARAQITPAEIAYLCASVNRYFTVALTPAEVVWSYSGVRPLYDNGADHLREVTRDYVLELDGVPSQTAPLITIYGGKLTTFRRLAEATLTKLAPYFPAMKPPWSACGTLPGASTRSQDESVDALAAAYPFLPRALVSRYQRAYGSDAFALLGATASIAEMGKHFGHDLYEMEVAYLMSHEWACCAEDILWRRSKLGLRFDDHQVETLERWVVSSLGSIDNEDRGTPTLDHLNRGTDSGCGYGR